MRKSRFYQISGNFRSGILSPAAQDDVTREDWLNGAAELTNFDILRDGGIRTRPRLVRGPQVPSLVRRVLYDFPEGGYWFHTPDAMGNLPEGARPLLLDGSPFLTLTLPGRWSNPTAVVLADVRLRKGPWNVGGELVFGVEVQAERLQDGTRPGPWTALDDVGNDGYHRYAFAPGRVRRDVVVQIPVSRNDRYRRLRGMRLRVRIDPGSPEGQTLAGQPLELRIAGAYAFDTRDLRAAVDRGGTHLQTLLDRQHGEGVRYFSRNPALPPDEPDPEQVPAAEQGWRIIPWTLRDLDLALVIGMNEMMVVGAPRTKTPWVPAVVVPPDAAWAFTKRQLEELDWATYGSHLLLAHEEFPRPLEVRLSGTGQLSVDYLKMENVPQLPPRLAPEARLDVRTDMDGQIVLDQAEPAQGAATRAVVPTNVRGVAGVGRAVVRWDDVGASRYFVFAQPEATYQGRDDPLWPYPGVQRQQSDTNVHEFTGLAGGTEYRFAVVSQVDVGPNAIAGITEPDDADDLVLTALRGALASTVLRGSASTTVDGAVSLNWNDVTDASGFRLEVRVGLGAWTTAAQQPVQRLPGMGGRPATSMTFQGTSGVQYSFRMVSTAPDRVDSPPSNEVVVQPMANLPGVPGGLTATLDPNVNGRVELTWDAGRNASSYDVEWDDNAGFSSPRQVNRSSRTYTLSFSPDMGAYAQQHWRVRSQRISAQGVLESAWVTGTFTPAWVPLAAAPTNLRIASIGAISGVHWDWPTYGAGLYRGAPDWEVQFGPADPGQAWYGIEINPAGRVPARPFLHNNGNQLPGARFRVRVRAAHRGASPIIRSPWSGTLTYTVPG